MRVSPGKLPTEYWPLYDAEDMLPPFCAVCGRTWPLNRHHIVWRSWPRLYEDGRELRKPLVMLCGSGSTSGCHGKAHRRELHFRVNDGALEYLETPGGMEYRDALEEEGWRPCRGEDW